MDNWLMREYPETIDLSEIEAREVTCTTYGGRQVFDAIDVSVADLLDTIGEDTVRKYFEIPEEE